MRVNVLHQVSHMINGQTLWSNAALFSVRRQVNKIDFGTESISGYFMVKCGISNLIQ